MAGITGTWDGEHIFFLLMKASPEKKQKLLDDFNKSLNYNTQSVREWKHASGLHCPNCKTNHSADIVRNGRMKPGSTRQRYFCRSCKSSFNDHTGTVFFRSKKVDRWPAFLKAMLDGKSIRQCAQEVGISPTTAHSWRKKILTHLLEHLNDPQLSGIVEYTEHTVKISNKGQKTAHPPLPKQKVTVVFCKSRLGGVYIGRGEDWKRSRISHSSGTLWHTHLTDPTHLPLPEKLHRPRAENTLLHTDHVMQIADAFSRHYRKMRGVATVYLHHYAVWHRFLEQVNGSTVKEKLGRLLRLCT
jgi:transposase-like protein